MSNATNTGATLARSTEGAVTDHELDDLLGNPTEWLDQAKARARRDHLMAAATAAVEAALPLMQQVRKAPVTRDDPTMQQFVGALIELDKAWRAYVRHTGKPAATIVRSLIASRGGEPVATLIGKVLSAIRAEDRRWLAEQMDRPICSLPRFNRATHTDHADA